MKNFLKWIHVKITLNEKVLPQNFFFKEQEIWWCSLGINVDIETDGKNESFERPVLILKVFNARHLWIVPLTHRAHSNKFYFPTTYGSDISYIILTQIRSISSKRLLRKIRFMDKYEFENVKEKIKSFL